ncbi:hypothetical protein M5K25_016198 [Dendrobium thyrsiflorum]|uniref:Uncharacterized protein n=1 Tax=Dendrobium thyrsiflorum TaxID=117978 RepID=A0ABD0URG2_DENTH
MIREDRAPTQEKMVLLCSNKTLIASNPFSSYLQSKPRLLFPFSSSPSLCASPNFQKVLTLSASSLPSASATSAQSLHLQHEEPTPASLTCADWGDFAARVSGEWDGCGAEFSPEGKPVELPEYVVPGAFREWGVQVFDWQTQCPTLASETREPLFFYKLIKLLPTVGCEADAATRHSVSERVAGGSENNVLAFGYHPSGRYICVGLVNGFEGKRTLELEHCFVNPKNWEERLRVIQVVRLQEGLVSLEKIWVFSEHWYGPFRNGEQLGGCAIKETGFALTKAVEVSDIFGEWKGIERFAVAELEGEQKDPIHQLVKVRSQNSIRGQPCLLALPKSLWCSLEVKEDGEICAEVGWLVDCGNALTSTCAFHKNGGLKEMIMEEEAKVLDGKVCSF